CKGALLKDARGILTRPSENTQAARQLRFTSLEKIVELEPVIKAYLREAIAAEKAGLKVTYKKITEHKVPEELQRKLDSNAAFKKAFQALTPGRQRVYLLHFSGAKQSQTRESRIEICTPDILKGKGLNEDYRTSRK
ncbi:MAG TPA: YdeI/OmpD-associated family protein, partial [Candidatus Methylacidiphilales bacterium]|nr:YdeI/OmpD-associated family protein [Candidatus Methylacidiphilales bacterium]